MALLLLLVGATCFLAYSNGANDNFKGVATLFGSNTTDYWRALSWATATTFAGAIASVFLAQTLVHRFSGKGLVPDAVAASPDFLLAVAVGAGLTVLLATLIGFPISTTHSLTGALGGNRDAGEAAAEVVLDHATRVGMPSMMTANRSNVARRLEQGYLGLLLQIGDDTAETIQLGLATAGR